MIIDYDWKVVILAPLALWLCLALGPLLVSNSVVAVEVGKFRAAWTRHGWSAKWDWRGQGRFVIRNGMGSTEQIGWSVGGLWPWTPRH